jgi:hypothetical protein
MRAVPRFVGQDGAADGQVVGLRPGAGEHDPARIAAKHRGGLLARGGQRPRRRGAAA